VKAVVEKGAKPGDKTKETPGQDEQGKKDAAGGKDDAGKADANKDGKQPDHVNDPIPPGVAEKTRERITYLAQTVNDLHAAAETQGAMVQAITDTGATPQEFGAMVGYLGAVHSDDPTRWEAAYQLLQSELRGLAIRMGKPLPEVNWLEGHTDLID